MVKILFKVRDRSLKTSGGAGGFFGGVAIFQNRFWGGSQFFKTDFGGGSQFFKGKLWQKRRELLKMVGGGREISRADRGGVANFRASF